MIVPTVVLCFAFFSPGLKNLNRNDVLYDAKCEPSQLLGSVNLSPVAYGRYLAPTRHNEAGRRSAVRRSSITYRYV